MTPEPAVAVKRPSAAAAAATVQPPALDDPSLYLSRELAILEFDKRVLAMSRDPSVPLLERLRYLTIGSTNLDEFFEIRVAGLKQQIASGHEERSPDGLSARETLARVTTEARAFIDEQYRILNKELVPALAAEGVRLVRRADWTPAQREWVRHYFRREANPVLTPIGLDPSHPFPEVLNKGLDFLVTLEGADAFNRHAAYAVMQAPRALPRLLAFPPEVRGGRHDYVLLSSIISEHVGDLFPGMKVTGCYQFRLTRNSDLWIDEEEAQSLLVALKGELPGRRYGAAVRLELPHHITPEAAEFLRRQVHLEPSDVYVVKGPVNLNRLATICDLTDRPDLKFPPFTPSIPKRLARRRSLFDVIRRGDVLLHHPYESFQPVVDLVAEAAKDPNVLAVRQTLYRTGAESPFVEALVAAARAGKEVTALVELRARFDEAANIDVATRLQDAGANVVYGIVGYKAHAKALLVVRREGAKLRRYVHLGTGNYHARTARLYTDLSLLTCDKRIGEDMHRLFRGLTGLGRAPRMKKLVQSPFALFDRLVELIAREADEARAGRPARIAARVNALVEPKIIEALYAASQAGVPIDLVVRGACCLRPGVPGVADNIRVRSIVGRFLEHGRVYHFHAGGERLVFGASADWMGRNLFRRVETCFPIENPRLKERVLDETIENYLADDAQSWALQADGSYVRATPGARPHSAQRALLERLA